MYNQLGSLLSYQRADVGSGTKLADVEGKLFLTWVAYRGKRYVMFVVHSFLCTLVAGIVTGV